jgi:hypothetical protein
LFDNGTMPDYTLTFVSGGNGAITGITVQKLASGGDTTSVIAVPAPGHQFVNWTGVGNFEATTANPLRLYNVSADMTITANFAPVPVDDASGDSDGGSYTIRVLNGTTTNHATLQDAYDNASDSSTMLIKDTTFTEDLLFNRGISIKLNGGMDSSYQTVVGVTTVKGSLTIMQGMVEVGSFVIK